MPYDEDSYFGDNGSTPFDPFSLNPPIDVVDVPLNVSVSDIVREVDAGRESPSPITSTSEQVRNLQSGIEYPALADVLPSGTPDFTSFADIVKTSRNFTADAVGILGDLSRFALGVKNFGQIPPRRQVAVSRGPLGDFINNLFGGSSGVGGGLAAPSPFGGIPWGGVLIAGGAAWWLMRRGRRW